jgi:hypothetical protein
MDAETIDAYVAATMDEPIAVLTEALRRLARAWAGPFRPAPATVIDRCYEVRREVRDHAPMDPPRLLQSSGFTLEDKVAIWQRCIDKARAQGYPESSGRIRFWQRGIARMRARGTDSADLSELVE